MFSRRRPSMESLCSSSCVLSLYTSAAFVLDSRCEFSISDCKSATFLFHSSIVLSNARPRFSAWFDNDCAYTRRQCDANFLASIYYAARHGMPKSLCFPDVAFLIFLILFFGMRNLTLFRDRSKDDAMVTDFGAIRRKLAYPHSFCAVAFHSEWKDRNMDERVNTDDCLSFVRSFVLYGQESSLPWTLDPSAEMFISVQCASPGRGGELVGVSGVCARCVEWRKEQ